MQIKKKKRSTHWGRKVSVKGVKDMVKKMGSVLVSCISCQTGLCVYVYMRERKYDLGSELVSEKASE